MVLFVMEIVPVAMLEMPTNVVTAVVVPLIPTWIEFAAVVLPMVLPLIVTLAPAPLVSIPRTTKPTAAVALLAVIPPTLLFWMLSVAAGAFAEMPSVRLAVVVEVIAIAPVVVAEPIVFPVVVPMLTEPPKTLIPAKTPGAVAKALVVENEIAVTVFP
jgi:hypothetical protein